MVSKSVLHRGVASTFAAEALACLQAVQIGVDIGLLVVIIEGDALSIIKKCQLDILEGGVPDFSIQSMEAKQ